MQTFDFKTFSDRYGGFVEFSSLMEVLPLPEPGKIWIAGGAIRRSVMKKPLDSDIDYFFTHEDYFERVRLEVERSFKIIKKIDGKNNLQYTIEFPVKNGEAAKEVVLQLIKIAFYPGPEELMNSFDFTLCQCSYDGVNLYFGDFALFDIASKKIVINKIAFPVASLRRLIKYTHQGFYACHGCLRGMFETVAANPPLLENATKYID